MTHSHCQPLVFKLNDIYEVRDAKVKQAKETLTGDAKQAAVKAAEDEKDAALYRCHFEFPAALSLYLDDKRNRCGEGRDDVWRADGDL